LTTRTYSGLSSIDLPTWLW